MSTSFSELDGVLDELVHHSREVFRDDLVGIYLVGSFALGDADAYSDCDFLVVVRRITDDQERAVRAFHDQIPTRDGHWTHHLEGSYALVDDLADNHRIGRDWLFVDHGHREMEWSEHCNREVVRWTLHHHGVALTGPPPHELVVDVPAAMISERMRGALPTLTEDILEWAPVDHAWTQRYLVTNYCRALYSLVTGEVTSKRRALLWGQERFGPRWRPLLQQVLDDRPRDFDPADPPRPGSLAETFAFARWCLTHADQSPGVAP